MLPGLRLRKCSLQTTSSNWGSQSRIANLPSKQEQTVPPTLQEEIDKQCHPRMSLAGGYKLIPSDKDAARWYEVVSNPGKTIDQIDQIDQARRVSKAVDSPGFMDWLDDLLKPFDYLCGNWW